MSIEEVATLDVLFVRLFGTGEPTDVDTLVGNPLTVVFATGGDAVVELLMDWCTVSVVFEPVFILKRIF